MKKFTFLTVALGALAVGCDTGTTGDTSCDDTAGCDTDTDPGQLLINDFTYTCEPDTSTGCGDDCGSMWDYEITASGANSGGLVSIDQAQVTDPWQESHDLTGESTVLSVSLVGGHVDDQTANVSTLFQCDMDTNMVWRYDLFPPEGGNTPADCVVASGASVEPSDIWGDDFGGCANGNSW